MQQHIKLFNRAISIMRDPEVTQVFGRLSNGPQCFCAEGCIVEAALQLGLLDDPKVQDLVYMPNYVRLKLYGDLHGYEFLLYQEEHASLINLNDFKQMPLSRIADLIEQQWLPYHEFD